MPSPIPSTLTDDQIRARTLEVFGKRPCIFQIRVCRAQLERHNVISIAPTGSGKTLSYLMTLAFSVDSVIILVTALNVLGDQFVREAEAVGYKAVFVNAENDNDMTFTSIRNLAFRLVVMTPGILVQRGGRCATMLWPHKAFTSRVQNLVFDEGHCIVQWGDTFRVEYSEVADILWLLPDTPICISSATMPPPMIMALREKFRFGNNYKLFHRSNDRINIAYTVVKMKHAAKTYEDLAFLVPKDWKDGDALPPKFMVFFDSKKEAEAASRYLARRVSLALRKKIPWFHAGMTKFFRVDEVERFKTGETWGLAATDSGGMGLDIPDVLIVVQWKVPRDLNLIQRFGRGARNPSLQAVAVLIAEPTWFYEVQLKRQQEKEKKRQRQAALGGKRKRRRVDVPVAGKHRYPQPSLPHSSGADSFFRDRD
ncbi:P-loop containing nucleoside triphosphate hydrolase protein [Polyporus arcularius HHB13444]|uniref:DNA 3'-5' helicase n=1 Tax=Polyporus arcularius HHB13444 TaxID=1314778 RepID=A0A5C3NMH3_9APHY|nr:P-loop containing nucleoside triphosphate hydrolase protein [Polyporus arcularius HHB13444]